MARFFKAAIDFDGTLAEHRFPDIGEPVPGAFGWLKAFQDTGCCRLILWTMRSDGQTHGDVLSDAIKFCADNGISFDSINEGIDDRNWTTSNKAHAHVYIDDAAFGCPLIESKEMGAPPMVDWSVVGPAVMEMIEAYQNANTF